MPQSKRTDYNSKDIAKAYLKENPDSTIKDYATAIKILNTYNNYVRLKVIEGVRVHLPFIGDIVVQRKRKNIKLDENGEPNIECFPVNWKETKKLWEIDEEAKKSKQLIRILNEHTDGYIATLKWDKSTAKIKNKAYYSLKFARDFKRNELVDSIKDNIYKYESIC